MLKDETSIWAGLRPIGNNSWKENITLNDATIGKFSSRAISGSVFQWLGFRVRVYPAMLYLGAVFGIIGGSRWAAAHGLATQKVYAAMLLLLIPALVGARLLFVAFHWEVYRSQPERIWQRTEGGAALYGGLILSFLTSLPLLAALGVDVWAFWDAGAVAMLIGMVFTKIGCLLNGCCAGRPAKSLFALYLADEHGVRGSRLPSQLFEAGLAGLVLWGSIRVAGRLPFDGSLFFSSLASFGAGRWMLEPTRDTIDRIGGVSPNRVISAGLVALALTGFVWLLFSGVLPRL